MKQKYYKLICNQDRDRTPSIGKNVAEDFFNLKLANGESVNLNFSFKNNQFKIEINKRKTRNEYRFFLNRIKDEIDYQVDDILIISRENDVFIMELLRSTSNRLDSDYSIALLKMGGKLHLLI